MRNPEERLQEIQRRADERFAAIRKTKRTVAWIASSAVMCMFIGLAIRTMSSVPPAPIATPTTTQVVTSTADGATTTSTDNSAIDTTTVVVPTTTDLPVIFYTTYYPLTTATAHGETETTSAGHTSGTAHTTTTVTRATSATTTKVVTTTVSSESPTTTTVAVTTTTHTSPSTTTTRNPDAGGNGNEMSPSTSPSATTTVRTTTTTATYAPSDPTTTTYATTTTTRAPSWEGGGDIQAPAAPGDTTTEPTATTTKPAYVFYSVSSAYEVSAGDIITVDVTVSDNHYMILGMIGVYYDKNALELLPVGNNPDSPYVDYANPDILPDENVSWFVNTPYEGALEFGFLSTSFCGSTTGGTIFRLTFRVLDGFEDRTEIHLEFPFMVSANNPNGTAADDYNTRILKASGIISADKKPKSPYW